jgi:creatinine amidohydrolase
LKLLDMTYEEVEDAIRENTPIVFPVGSIEQHGPHLPLGTDGYIASSFAQQLAERHRIVLAPTVYYASYSAPKSGGGRTFVGSIGLPSATLTAVLRSVISECFRQGFRRLVVLNGHFENAHPASESLEELLGPGGTLHSKLEQSAQALLVNWWHFLDDGDLSDMFGTEFPGFEAEHAGILETSLMEYLFPSLVRIDRKVEGGATRTVPYEIFPAPQDTLWPNGIGTTAVPASRDLGQKITELVVARISQVLKEEFEI